MAHLLLLKEKKEWTEFYDSTDSYNLQYKNGSSILLNPSQQNYYILLCKLISFSKLNTAAVTINNNNDNKVKVLLENSLFDNCSGGLSCVTYSIVQQCNTYRNSNNLQRGLFINYALSLSIDDINGIGIIIAQANKIGYNLQLSKINFTRNTFTNAYIFFLQGNVSFCNFVDNPKSKHFIHNGFFGNIDI